MTRTEFAVTVLIAVLATGCEVSVKPVGFHKAKPVASSVRTKDVIVGKQVGVTDDYDWGMK